MTRRLSLLLPILLGVPIHAIDPPKDLLGTFKAARFDKVDRLDGLPDPVRQAVHDQLKQRCDALQKGVAQESEAAPMTNADRSEVPPPPPLFDTPGIANPGEKWTATDVIIDPQRPRRRLLFAGASPSLWFMYYEHGGIGRHEHLAVIGKDAAGEYWVRWVRNPHLGGKGVGMTRLKRLAAAGRLATSEEDTGE